MAAQLVVGAASLLINVLAARAMGPAGRGSLALLLQVAYLTNMIAVAGTDRAYPASISLRRGARAATGDAGRLLAPSATVALAVSAPIVFAIGAGSPSGGWLTLVAFVVAALAMVSASATRTGAAASGVAGPFVAGTVAGQLVLVAAVAVVAARGVDSPGVWLLVYGASLGTAPVVSWALLRRGRAGATDAPPDLGPARRLGLRLLPAGLASIVMLRTDRLLLPWLGSYEQLGIYIVVATVAEFATWPVQSYVDSQAPRWHHRFLAGTLGRVRPLLGAAAYGLVAGAALLIAGHLLVPTLFGSEYRGSVGLLTPLAVGTLCYSVSRVAVGLGVVSGRARTALVADIPAMVVAVSAYLLLIPRWGAMGAAVGSAIAYGTGAVLAVLAAFTMSAAAPGPSAGRGRRSTRTGDPQPQPALPN
ncbi:lipopolysaccharide biosynthesis protein [Micromonospora chersina]|uniref:lipopolysaccharide biosynthesis protein n=1 Tax=Micromonospora chersina TaxID=47854 RepID=UPI00371FD447